MSWMALVTLDPENKTAEYFDCEFHNSWRGAMHFWDEFAKVYFGAERGFYDVQDRQAFWDAFDDQKINPSHRAVLGMTYDHFYIAKENFERTAEDIRIAMRGLCFGGHWPEVRDCILEAAKDDDVKALGFYWTSCGESVFGIGCDPEHYTYDWSQIREVYAELKVIDAPETA